MTWRDKWNDINNRMHLERRALLQEMIDQKISRSQAAMELGKATASVSNMVDLYNLNWPLFDGPKGGRRGYTPEQYRSFAEAGFTKLETAKAMGVTWNNVDGVARRNKITFKDGRRKDD